MTHYGAFMLATELIGQTATFDEVMAEIRRQVPGARLQAEGLPLTIAPGLSEEGLEQLLPGRQSTSLADGRGHAAALPDGLSATGHG